MMNKKYIEDIINQEIIEKYSIDILNIINDFPENVKSYLKFAILRFDINEDEDLEMIKCKLLDPIKNNKIDMRSKKEIIELINSYLGISEVERKTFGEVSTPIYDKPGCVNEQLSLLDDDFWTNPYCKVLDCAVGIGNYPTVLLDKFMNGLKNYKDDKIDLIDSNVRYKWIMENIIYVVDINPKNLWIYYNIFDEKNELEMNYYLGSFLEEGFDNHMKDVWKIDKWDLICTNPPYQSGSEDIRGSKSIYNIFIEKSHIIADKTIMITPSRWFSNIDLKIFREKMINSFGLKILKHYENGCDIFGKNIEIKGGVSYFLLDKNYCGDVLFNEKHITFSQNIISTDNISTLIEKIIKTENISSEFNSGSYFKIETNDKRVSDKNDIKCFMSKNNGYIKYISKSDLDIKPNIKKWKVLIPSASGSKNNIGSLGNIRIAKPNEVCSASFVHFAFDTELESTNFSLYIKTNLIKYLIKLRKPTQRVKKDIFEWVPKLDFTRTWTDEELYNYFNLTQEEIDLIEKTIK